jgi:hypothetical protein
MAYFTARDESRRRCAVGSSTDVLVRTAYLLAGNDYSAFMDASWLPSVTETWRAVVPPNHVLLIGLLIMLRQQWAC